MEPDDPPASPPAVVVAATLTSSPTRLPESGFMLDLGSQRRRDIKQLKRGDGPLAHEIATAVQRAREELGINPAAELVPVVLLYRRRDAYRVVIIPPREAQT
jgi:hypothetical protein